MHHSLRSGAICCFLLLVAASASAEAESALAFQSASIDAPESYALDGALVGFFQETDARVASTPPNVGMELKAPILHVEVDATERSIRTGVVEVPITPTTTFHNHTTATLNGIAAGENLRWFLVPQPGADAPHIRVDGECSTLRASDATEEFARIPRVRADPGFRVDPRYTVEWEGCGKATLTVTGDLLLVLWETDVSVLSSEGDSDYWSGARQTTAAPGLTHDQELWIYALNATFTLPITQGSMFTLVFGHGASVTSHLAILRDVQLPAHARQVAELRVEGDFVIPANVRGSKLGGAIEGQVTLAIADGKSLELPAPAVAAAMPAQATNWLWGLAIFPVLLLATFAHQRPMSWFRRGHRYGELPPNYVAVTRRHRRAAGYMVKAQEWLERGRLRRAAWASGRSTKLRPENVHHQLLRVSVLDEQGRPEAALKTLQLFYDQADAGRPRAIVALEVAASLAKLRRRAEADEWLERAAQDDPAAVSEARRDSYFQAMHGKPAPRRSDFQADPSFA